MPEKLKEFVEGLLAIAIFFAVIAAIAFVATWGWWRTPDSGIEVKSPVSVLVSTENAHSFEAILIYKNGAKAIAAANRLCESTTQTNSTVQVRTVDGEWLKTCQQDR